jgi:hypothetical protein
LNLKGDKFLCEEHGSGSTHISTEEMSACA